MLRRPDPRDNPGTVLAAVTFGLLAFLAPPPTAPAPAPVLAAPAPAEPAALPEQEVVSIWAGTQGHLDDVPVEDIRRFEGEFHDYLRRERDGILRTIAETKQLTDDTISSLTDAITDFKKQFETSSGEQLIKDEPVDAMDQSEVGQETITRHVRRPPAEQRR